MTFISPSITKISLKTTYLDFNWNLPGASESIPYAVWNTDQCPRSACLWVRSWNCGCLFTWFCYQLIAKPGNKAATVSWPDPYTAWTHATLDCSIVPTCTAWGSAAKRGPLKQSNATWTCFLSMCEQGLSQWEKTLPCSATYRKQLLFFAKPQMNQCWLTIRQILTNTSHLNFIQIQIYIFIAHFSFTNFCSFKWHLVNLAWLKPVFLVFPLRLWKSGTHIDYLCAKIRHKVHGWVITSCRLCGVWLLIHVLDVIPWRMRVVWICYVVHVCTIMQHQAKPVNSPNQWTI